MKILRNVRNQKKKTREKFGIKIPGDTNEAVLMDERNGDSKWAYRKVAVHISWIGGRTLANNQVEISNCWLSTNEEEIPTLPVSWIEGRTSANNQVKRGNCWLTTN
eukprot:3854065-Ditylum_brightwellii.AAC.3